MAFSRWLPNKNYLRALMSMGIRKSDAVKALYHTNNSSADSAATWLFESIDTVNSSQMPPGVRTVVIFLHDLLFQQLEMRH